jgi:hypothetical protein
MCCARLPIEMLLRGNGAGIWEGRESEALELGLIGGARVSGALSQSPAACHAARFVCSRAPLQVRNSQATPCGVTARLAPQMEPSLEIVEHDKHPNLAIACEMSAPSILTAICCGEAERCQDVVTCRCQAAVRTTVIINARITFIFSPLFCNLLLQVVSYGGHVRHLNCCKGGLNDETDSSLQSPD